MLPQAPFSPNYGGFLDKHPVKLIPRGAEGAARNGSRCLSVSGGQRLPSEINITWKINRVLMRTCWDAGRAVIRGALQQRVKKWKRHCLLEKMVNDVLWPSIAFFEQRRCCGSAPQHLHLSAFPADWPQCSPQAHQPGSAAPFLQKTLTAWQGLRVEQIGYGLRLKSSQTVRAKWVSVVVVCFSIEEAARCPSGSPAAPWRAVPCRLRPFGQCRPFGSAACSSDRAVRWGAEHS